MVYLKQILIFSDNPQDNIYLLTFNWVLFLVSRFQNLFRFSKSWTPVGSNGRSLAHPLESNQNNRAYLKLAKNITILVHKVGIIDIYLKSLCFSIVTARVAKRAKVMFLQVFVILSLNRGRWPAAKVNHLPPARVKADNTSHPGQDQRS